MVPLVLMWRAVSFGKAGLVIDSNSCGATKWARPAPTSDPPASVVPGELVF